MNLKGIRDMFKRFELCKVCNCKFKSQPEYVKGATAQAWIEKQNLTANLDNDQSRYIFFSLEFAAKVKPLAVRM